MGAIFFIPENVVEEVAEIQNPFLVTLGIKFESHQSDLVQDENDDDLYMDLSTLSRTNLLPAEETMVTPVPPPRGINAKKVAEMIPKMDKGSEFQHIPEERKAKLLNSLKNRLKLNKTKQN